jgi:AcrR family transcriptional regulator
VSAQRRDDGGEGARRPLGPLPAGHHGLSPEQVAESQRERLLAATAQLAAERGYRALTITDIAKTASVANRVFYDNFADKEEVFLATFEAVLVHLEELIAAAVEPLSSWPERVIEALRTALAFFAAEPDLARICLVAPLTASPAIVGRFRQAISDAVPLLELGRSERPAAKELPPSTEDALLGGLIALISEAILSGDEPLASLLPDLVDFVLAPFLGADAARELAAQAADSSAP